MIQKILVPVDFSEGSLNALESAVIIASNNNALLQILHITDIMPGVEVPYSIKKAKLICDAMAGNILIDHGIKAEIIFAEGIVGHVIAKIVFENKSDLVIMGSHGLSGARELFIGSNSYYVIKRVACPVLLIPEGKKWIEFDKILFPVRPSVFSLKLYEFIYSLVRHNKAIGKIKIFNISTDQFENDVPQLSATVLEIKDKYHDNKIEVAVSISKNRNIAESVLAKAKQMQADLIVISPGIDIADNPFFIGPFSQRIINHSRIPILSILRTS
jgi:nucleotide-binding universal stress UspA family protein